ncbi:hypothetical protein DFP72DRAFT_853992 [Ephemerocybe angulata]|uniref:Uncharacterized protein n=1 Tax=Ephemerocybe angulata TaxID=980116 RepID=A0A8H6M0H5_9AGAR|nr:hypothetical protein DFP72DRAFT_853992 [Tulosesus angulatus]
MSTQVNRKLEDMPHGIQSPDDYFGNMDNEELFFFSMKVYKALKEQYNEADRLYSYHGKPSYHDWADLRHWASMLAVASAEAGLGDAFMHTKQSRQLGYRLMAGMALHHAEAALSLGDKARTCVARRLRGRGFKQEAEELENLLALSAVAPYILPLSLQPSVRGPLIRLAIVIRHIKGPMLEVGSRKAYVVSFTLIDV